MNERIKKLRKVLDMTQKEFGEHIGMKQNTIALIESGRSTSDQTIFSICREFNVNEEWLRTGAGEMFNEEPETVLDALAAEYNLSMAARAMVEKFVKMKPENRKVIIDAVLEIAESIRNSDTEDPSPPEYTLQHPITAEAAYEKSLGIAQNSGSTVSNTTAGTGNAG